MNWRPGQIWQVDDQTRPPRMQKSRSTLVKRPKRGEQFF
jgi:hypothetical protein